jgi:predicted Zn-dependent protease
MSFRTALTALVVVSYLGGCAAPAVVLPTTHSGPVTADGNATPGIATDARPRLDPDARAAARMFVQVVERVEPVAEATCREMAPRSNCDFRIVVDDRPGSPPNAFQTLDSDGNPIIAFTLALILDVRNADELAFVMAHEAAHHISGHLDRQREIATLGAAVFGQLAGAGGATPEGIRSAQEIGAVVGARTYSQDFELEADALGTRIAARAGFNPLVGAEFFFRLPDPGNRFLGTHPPNAQRVATVERVAAQLGITR